MPINIYEFISKAEIERADKNREKCEMCKPYPELPPGYIFNAGQICHCFCCIRKKTVKTHKQWHGSGLNLNEFLQVGDLVDEEMADYFLCVLPPATHSSLLIQIGEPYSHVNGRPTFATIKKTQGGWEYRGNCHAREATEPTQKP